MPYAAPPPWRSAKGGEPIAPPDPAKEGWRVFVNQQRPMQRETPLWRTLPATENVAVKMPDASRYRCIVTPLQVEADHNDFNTKLYGWLLQRDLLCSADQWRSWTVHPHKVQLALDGTRKVTAAAEVFFSERDSNAQVRDTFVLVRDEPERREATTGPPQILPNKPVDDD